MKKIISDALKAHQQAFSFLETQGAALERIAGILLKALKDNGKILTAGNGGSASDAQHFTAELVGRFKKNRRPLPALALTANSALITALGNDFGYDEIFRTQIAALGNRHDVLVVFSTSGNSRNVIRAVEEAKKMGIPTIGFLGKDGGTLKNMVDTEITIPFETPRAQEMHGLVGHILAEIIETELFRLS